MSWSLETKISILERAIVAIQFPFLMFAVFFGLLKFKRYYIYGHLLHHYSKHFIDVHFPMTYIDAQITKFTLYVLALNFLLSFIKLGKPIKFE